MQCIQAFHMHFLAVWPSFSSSKNCGEDGLEASKDSGLPRCIFLLAILSISQQILAVSMTTFCSGPKKRRFLRQCLQVKLQKVTCVYVS